MKVANLSRPIRSSMLEADGWRMDADSFLSGKTEALLALKRFNTEQLPSLCIGGIEGIYRGPQHRRWWVTDPATGVPFLSSSDMLMADISRLPYQRSEHVKSSRLACLAIKPHSTLISASGTIGRVVFARPDMDGMWSSEDIMKVLPDDRRIPPGYLFAFLAGEKFGQPLIKGGTHGSMIQHIEPQHLADIPVPRLGRLEAEVHRDVQRAAELRAAWQAAIQTATDEVFTAVGLRDITALEWHARHDQDLGYAVRPVEAHSFLPLNYANRAQWLKQTIEGVKHRRLVELVKRGTLTSGVRFKRIDADPSVGLKLIGQKDLFSAEPEGRWIARFCLPSDAWADIGTILIAAQGTLGEFEVFCQAAMVYESWADVAFSQHMLRVVPSPNEIEPGFLFAYLRSQTAFRQLRCMAYGTKLQDLHPGILRQMPVPYPDKRIRTRIHESVMAAFAGRAEADRLERDAIARVERAIDEE